MATTMSTGRLDGFRPATVDSIAQDGETLAGAAVDAALAARAGLERRRNSVREALTGRVSGAWNWLSWQGQLANAAAERHVEEGDDALARFYQSTNAPAAAMVGVLIVAAVIFLMPTILGRIQQATPNVSGPLGDINNGEQAASIVQFSWLVPLLIVVFVVISYLRAAQ
jgi:hypothetical protein